MQIIVHWSDNVVESLNQIIIEKNKLSGAYENDKYFDFFKFWYWMYGFILRFKM